MRTMLAFSAVGLMISSAALAQDAAAPVPVKKKDDGSKVVCKTEQFVGSIIPRRICKTKAEWEAAAENSQHYLDEKRRLGVDQQSIRGRSGG
jgi:hypothetical protein